MSAAIFILIGILMMSLYGYGLKFQEWKKTKKKLEQKNKILNKALHLACQQIAKETESAETEIGDKFIRQAIEKMKNENNSKFLY